MNTFANLAQQIVNSNDQNAYSQMQSIICDPDNIQRLLHQIPHSDALHFTFTQLLSKSILNGQFCPVNQTQSDDNSMKENSNEKVKLYSLIIPRIFQSIMLQNFEKKQYILRSALNAMSICLKDLCDNNKNLGLFTNILSNTLFPTFKVNEYFTSSLNGELVFLQPSQAILNYFMMNSNAIQIYKYSAKILIELLQYVVMVTVYKSYYQYRRNIYSFRNTYLSTILNVAAEYHKILYSEWKRNPLNRQIIDAITISISLIEKIITYPFSLTLHEFESEEEAKDSIVGLNSEIYFPTFYRNVLCDASFLDTIFQFYLFLLKELNHVNQLGQTVYCIIRILGRIISASVYTFNTEQQRKVFRGICADMIITMLYSFKFYDALYIDFLSDIFNKVLSSYTTMDLQQRREKIYQGIIFFCQNLIQNCEIKLEDGKRNPFNRAFDVMVVCINETKDTIYTQKINQKSQQFLNKAFLKLHNWQYAQKIMKQFGKNQKHEIQCFEELFQHIHAIFAVNLERNLETLKNLQIQKFTQSQQTIWLHLCSILLPSHLANRQQTQLILRFFRVANKGKTIACLHYMQVLVNQVLFQMDNGSPTTSLWTHITQIQGCTFANFILHIIRICKNNFQQTELDLIDFSLEVFKSIYAKLKKSKNQSSTVAENYDPFYYQVKLLISNLGQTVFENPKFFKRRVQLFNVISTIWLNSQNYKHIQQIYGLVSSGIKKQMLPNQQYQIKINPISLLKYMHDMRGILEPIQDSDCFKIVCELSIQDLSQILPLAFNSQQNISTFFGEEMFLKAFCKMVLQFTTDHCRRLTYHVQTELPFIIYDLFKPYLIEAAKYDYPKSLVSLWWKFSTLNILQEMLPLVPSFKQKQSKDFPSLIKQYFDNIHRTQLNQLYGLYPYIEDRVEYLCLWWEEVIRRQLKPNVSIKQVVQSRIATSKRQKQELAKLLFFVGQYDSNYWNIEQFQDQRQYVKYFVDNYKGWRQ